MPNRNKRRPLTLRDVSEASGVSEMTVSRVLRNRGDVSAATREKVLTAAKSLGYVPNKIAGGLASQHSNGPPATSAVVSQRSRVACVRATWNAISRVM